MHNSAVWWTSSRNGERHQRPMQSWLRDEGSNRILIKFVSSIDIWVGNRIITARWSEWIEKDATNEKKRDIEKQTDFFPTKLVRRVQEIVEFSSTEIEWKNKRTHAEEIIDVDECQRWANIFTNFTKLPTSAVVIFGFPPKCRFVFLLNQVALVSIQDKRWCHFFLVVGLGTAVLITEDLLR